MVDILRNFLHTSDDPGFELRRYILKWRTFVHSSSSKDTVDSLWSRRTFVKICLINVWTSSLPFNVYFRGTHLPSIVSLLKIKYSPFTFCKWKTGQACILSNNYEGVHLKQNTRKGAIGIKRLRITALVQGKIWFT